MLSHGLSSRWQYYATHPWTFAADCYRQVKWFCQRGYRGYADCDSWSLDYYLNAWMPEAVRSLKQGMGVPCEFEHNPQGWPEVLETIAKGFEAAKKLNDMEYETHQEAVEIQKTMHKGLGLFCKYYLNLWD